VYNKYLFCFIWHGDWHISRLPVDRTS